MDALMVILPVTLYILGIILLIVLIVLGIKLIETIDRANVVLDDIEKKTKSLNGVFHMIDTVTDTLSYVSDSLVEGIVSGISRLFSKKEKRKKKKEMDEDE